MRRGEPALDAAAKVEVPPAEQVSVMIVIVDVEDDVGNGSHRVHAFHPQVGLVHAEPTDAVIADWFLQMRREVLLPGLRVARLVAVRETVAEGVTPALALGKMEHA